MAHVFNPTVVQLTISFLGEAIRDASRISQTNLYTTQPIVGVQALENIADQSVVFNHHIGVSKQLVNK